MYIDTGISISLELRKKNVIPGFNFLICQECCYFVRWFLFLSFKLTYLMCFSWRNFFIASIRGFDDTQYRYWEFVDIVITIVRITCVFIFSYNARNFFPIDKQKNRVDISVSNRIHIWSFWTDGPTYKIDFAESHPFHIEREGKHSFSCTFLILDFGF
jgi:hypothetical protein